MSKIHKAAIISKGAEIDSSVEIGPYVIIEDNVKIAKGVKIHSHACIYSGSTIGEDTEINVGALLGGAPQDVSYEGAKTYLNIGKKNIIREYVTMHRGTQEGSSTDIGDENFFMALSHVGHNCKVANKVILANGALLGGHAELANGVFLSGNVPVHQHCRVGEYAMIGGLSAVNSDIPPYMSVRGVSRVRTINIVGLKRAGFSKETIRAIKKAFVILYKSELTLSDAIAKMSESNPCKEVMNIVNFVKKAKKGIGKHKFSPQDSEDFS